jgi:hypothetical protein
MQLVIDDDFRAICRRIVQEYEARGEDSLVWSDDQYQQGSFCGGWEPERGRFYFSYYAPDGGDYIFWFTLEETRSVASGGTIDPPLEFWKKAPEW